MSMSGERVLCVDDDVAVCRLVSRLLERAGYATVAAADMAEARVQLALEDFALVLCDINLPGQSGLEFLREFPVERSDIAIVMVTAHDDPGLAQAAFDLGAYGYVVKPFESNELLISVANALRRRQLELERRVDQRRLEGVTGPRSSVQPL